MSCPCDRKTCCPCCKKSINFIDSSRVMIKQDPQKEGIIELRRGVEDLSLGDRHWAQVRIRVGNAYAYIKGMAVYSEDVPEGYDVIFHIGKDLREDGVINGFGIDTDNKFKKPLTIIEPEPNGWKAWVPLTELIPLNDIKSTGKKGG